MTSSMEKTAVNGCNLPKLLHSPRPKKREFALLTNRS